MNAPAGDFETGESDPATNTRHERVLLKDLERGKCDDLGYKVLEIFMRFSDYAIYRTERGIFVQFSDDEAVRTDQRGRIADISPELCELRYLTCQMRGSRLLNWLLNWLPWRKSATDSLFDHNLAEAIMLSMEKKKDESQRIVKTALAMAVMRVTNDNMIRYVASSIAAAVVLSVAAFASPYYTGRSDLWGYVTAGAFGTLGAVFSIIVRVQAFEMKPCQQSNMNYWMAGIRVGIGLIGGFMLFLIASKASAGDLLNPALFGSEPLSDWRGAALVGFLGGFAERLVRTMLKRAADTVMENSGTAVQEVRKQQEKAAAKSATS